MRAPGTGLPDWKGPKHFLTDWYTNLFQLECIPFINYCKEGFCCFYGQPKIRMEGQCMKSSNHNLILLQTRVYSWNTYPARLSICCQIDSAYIFAYGSTLLTITTTCDFKRGGAMKPIIGSS